MAKDVKALIADEYQCECEFAWSKTGKYKGSEYKIFECGCKPTGKDSCKVRLLELPTKLYEPRADKKRLYEIQHKSNPDESIHADGMPLMIGDKYRYDINLANLEKAKAKDDAAYDLD